MMTDEEKNIEKFIILDARSRQIQIMDFATIVQNTFMPVLPRLVRQKVPESLNFLKGEFDSEEDFEAYIQSNIESDLNSYPNILWYSLFVQSFFHFEDDLNLLCKKLQELHSITVSLSDINGKGINRARKFLIKVIGVDFSSLDLEWNRIKIFQKIRNLIAHAAGNLTNSSDERVIRNYLDEKGENFVDERGYITINQPIVIEVADTIREFWLGMNLELFYEE